MTDKSIQWLLDSGEPWTRYRALVDLLDRPTDDPQVVEARADMLSHPKVQALLADTADWPGHALKRHNDAKHMLYKFSTLADFGVDSNDPGIHEGLEAILAHQSPQGPFLTLAHLYKRFTGIDGEHWVWMACDAPTLLYVLISMGLGEDQRVEKAMRHLANLVQANGWRCAASPKLGRFKGPGRKEAPCPIANVYALKALSLVPEMLDSQAGRAGVEMLLKHWEQRGKIKHFLFGIGTDYHKLKYPLIWYDILHVAEVLSRYPCAKEDPRFIQMLNAITGQADSAGRYTASSMYMAWKGWSFADKKEPSPWLTFLVYRILKRAGKYTPQKVS
jgi:hypothetical protein